MPNAKLRANEDSEENGFVGNEDEGEGPASPKSSQVKARLTGTMHKDLRVAAAQTGETQDGLMREGLRCVLYGIEPRRRGILKKIVRT